MNRTDTVLRHMREDCEDILEFIDGITEEQFLQSKLIRNAVGMSLINIGELVKALPEDFRLENPQLPWRRIAGMRDLVAHKYQSLDMQAVWNVAKERVPEILIFIRAHLSRVETS